MHAFAQDTDRPRHLRLPSEGQAPARLTVSGPNHRQHTCDPSMKVPHHGSATASDTEPYRAPRRFTNPSAELLSTHETKVIHKKTTLLL